ncbi:MAG TPA: CbrC family protein [Pyrinomonadaceae bacterium]|nr:CbrC family protein [Pyrinomonadaceae bacterium]
MDLPTFKYHPDPLATGSIEPSSQECLACGQARGFIYKGLPYAEQELIDAFCPWCIADGKAHEQFGAEFVDAAGVGGYGLWQPVSDEIVGEVAYRTPGFIGWQQEKWFTHCRDAGEFLGRAGKGELLAFGSEAIRAIKEEIGFEDKEWEEYFASLDKEGEPTAYIFRCRHCGALGGYSDFT